MPLHVTLWVSHGTKEWSLLFWAGGGGGIVHSQSAGVNGECVSAPVLQEFLEIEITVPISHGLVCASLTAPS